MTYKPCSRPPEITSPYKCPQGGVISRYTKIALGMSNRSWDITSLSVWRLCRRIRCDWGMIWNFKTTISNFCVERSEGHLGKIWDRWKCNLIFDKIQNSRKSNMAENYVIECVELSLIQGFQQYLIFENRAYGFKSYVNGCNSDSLLALQLAN